HSAQHDSGAGAATESGEPRREPWGTASRTGERLERKQPSLARRAAGQLCTRGILLGDGVPFAAGVAFALPAAVGRAAVLADEGRFATGHGSDMAHLVRVRDVRSAKPKARNGMAQRPRRWPRITRPCKPGGSVARDW